MLVHSLKAYLPTEVTDAGIWIDCRLVHLLKANSSIEVTDDGIWIDKRLRQERKAKGPIVVDRLGSFECVADFRMMIDERFTHPSNALSPKEVTDDGRLTVSRLIQS